MSVSWQVTGQLSGRYSYDGSGAPVLGHEISFITGNGTRDYVFVPADKYNEVSVRAAIEAKARIVDRIDHLTSAG